MPAIARIGIDQISTGHGCDGTAGILGQLQNSVFVNGFSVAVQGDAIAPHTILEGDDCVPHSAVINSGSSKVFISGIPVGRIGDSADAGSIISGSPNVFAGG
jgi:uncharacterized Zn-binding protein involved in type VI secretion